MSTESRNGTTQPEPQFGGEFSLPKELESLPESILIPTADVITISGQPGTFKSTVVDLLGGVNTDPKNAEVAPEVKITGFTLEKIGEKVRTERERETGEPFLTQHKLDYSVDRRNDAEQMERMRKARFLTPIGIEGRSSGFLGAAVAQELKGTLDAPRIVRVLLYNTDADERYGIIHNRERQRNPELTFRAVRRHTEARETAFQKRMEAVWPELVVGQDIFDPNMQTPRNGDVYNVSINTMGKFPPQIVREIVDRLTASDVKGLRRFHRNEFPLTPEGQNAYRMVAELTHCEARQAGHPCNRFSTRTVDIYTKIKEKDTYKLVEQAPACDKYHAQAIRDQFTRNIKNQTEFGINGQHPIQLS